MKSIKKKGYMVLFIAIISMICLIRVDVYAQDEAFPKREVQVILAYGAGGLSDLSFRTFARPWESTLGTNIMVINKKGAAGLIAGKFVSNAKPDGYTLGYFGGRQIFPEIYAQTVPYNSSALEPLFLVCFGIPSIAVKADSPWVTLKDFVNYVKEKPGIKTAWTGRGATPHLTALTLGDLAGIEFRGVPYGDDVGSLTALLAGDAEVAFLNALATVSHVKAGDIRVLAVHSLERISILPDVPTYIEQGFKMPIGILSFVAVFSPPGVPDRIKEILIKTAQDAHNNPDNIKGLIKLGVYPKFSSGKDFQDILDEYRDIVGTLVKKIGLFQN